MNSRTLVFATLFGSLVILGAVLYQRQRNNIPETKPSQPMPDLATTEFDDTWSVAETMVGEKPMIIRIRQNLRDVAGHPDLPTRLRIVWDYGAGSESGLPGPDVSPRLDECEELLLAALEPGNTAVLTHVLTSDGLRQWVFYASDVSACGASLNEHLPHEPPMPIELTADSDVDWLEYTETLDTLGL